MNESYEFPGSVCAARLKAERERMGLTRKEMAAYVNTGHSAYSSWENGGLPGAMNLVEIARKLNLSIDYLVGITDKRRTITNE